MDTGKQTFEQQALTLFRYQAKNNAVYKSFVAHLNIDPEGVYKLTEIPFLPVSFFKTHKVQTGNFTPEAVFTTSGTTGNQTGKHYVKSLNHYERYFTEGFEAFYGAAQKYVILALLPSYIERQGSSLVYMAQKLITQSGRPESGFYLNNITELIAQIKKLEAKMQPTILLGVSFALLNLAEKYSLKLQNTIVMETGGMKGRHKELTREALHEKLTQSFGTPTIHSEYGMTELLSQAYSAGMGVFYPSPSMRVLIRDTYDPMHILPHGHAGGINIIDLANIHSCAFIAIQDLGKTLPDGGFEVLGRFDNSDIRGCNLLVS